MTSGYLPLGRRCVGERVRDALWADTAGAFPPRLHVLRPRERSARRRMANLDIIEREGLRDRVRALEPVLEGALRPLESHELVAEVRTGIGLLAGIQLHDAAVAQRVASGMLARGVIGRTLPDGVIHVAPPFVVGEDDLAMLAEVVADALDDETA